MKVTVSLAVVVASALAASAKPSDSFMGALLGRQQDQDLHARGTVDPSSIAPSCQSSCTNIVKTLDACSGAACECTQDNYSALEGCINCLAALSPPSLSFSPGYVYLNSFFGACEASGAQLKSVGLTATPTGKPGATNPLLPFELPVPTGTDFSQFSVTLPPLVPTPSPGAAGKGTTSGSSGNSGNSSSSGNSGSSGSGSGGGGGGAIGLSPVWALGTSAVVAISVAIAVQGASFL